MEGRMGDAVVEREAAGPPSPSRPPAAAATLNDATLFLRLPGAVVARLDAAVVRARARMPGPRWTRSDLVRLYIERGLAHEESEQTRQGSSETNDL